MKLSDGTFIAATSSAIVGEPSMASCGALPGATPLRAARAIVTPRRLSAAANAFAAVSGGLDWKRRPTKPRLKVRALSGPT